MDGGLVAIIEGDTVIDAGLMDGDINEVVVDWFELVDANLVGDFDGGTVGYIGGDGLGWVVGYNDGYIIDEIFHFFIKYTI